MTYHKPQGAVWGLVLLACAVLWPLRAGYAQVDGEPRTHIVEILHADSTVGTVVGGQRVRQLIGNVQLRQDDTWMRANRATQFVEREEVLFEGRVRIIQEKDTLDADRVLYNSRTKTGVATGQVRLSDGEAVLNAPSGTYFMREKRAWFDEGVRLVDSVSVLTSRSGAYWTEEKRAEFYDEVVLNQGRMQIEADSITHLRESDISLARGHVFMRRFGGREGEEVDSTSVTLLFGGRARYDNRQETSLVEVSPLLIQVRHDSTGADTLAIQAHRFEGLRNDTLERMIAVDSVRIWQKNFAAVADSAVYERLENQAVPDTDRAALGEDRLAPDADRLALDEGRIALDQSGTRAPPPEVIRLYKDPIGWFKQTQVSGDTLLIFAQNGQADSLWVQERAFAAQWDSTLSRVQQLEGRMLHGYFEEGNLHYLTVGPNASAIYYLANDDDALDGAVQMSGDRIAFHFEEEELRRVEATRGIEGVYYDAGLIPDPFQLDGYRWLPERRPEKRHLLQLEQEMHLLAKYRRPETGDRRPEDGDRRPEAGFQP